MEKVLDFYCVFCILTNIDLLIPKSIQAIQHSENSLFLHWLNL